MHVKVRRMGELPPGDSDIPLSESTGTLGKETTMRRQRLDYYAPLRSPLASRHRFPPSTSSCQRQYSRQPVDHNSFSHFSLSRECSECLLYSLQCCRREAEEQVLRLRARGMSECQSIQRPEKK